MRRKPDYAFLAMVCSALAAVFSVLAVIFRWCGI